MVGCRCLRSGLIAGLIVGPRIFCRWKLLRMLVDRDVDTLVASIHSSNSSRVRGIRPRIIGHGD